MVLFSNFSGRTYLKYVVALLLLGFIAFWLSRPENIKVDVTSPTINSVEEKVTNTRAGTITACKRAKLSLPIGGQIADILVDEGDQVQAAITP